MTTSENPRPPSGEHPVSSGDVLDELHRHEKSERWQLKLQTAVLLLGIVGTILGGAKWLVSATWAQGKEHADAGVTVLRAEFAAHVKEETQSRQVTLDQVKEQRTETRELRQELRAVYDYMKTGREQPTLEKPLPPMDGGR